MKIGEKLEAKGARKWREWLSENHDKEKEIWLIFYRKNTGKQAISIQESIDEALCFGWIDNFGKGMDEEKFALRFSPRKPNSSWSKINIDRAKKLIAEGKMTKVGLEIFNKSKLV